MSDRAHQALVGYEVESQSEKLARKSKESPFMIVGLVGCALACGYGIYKYKYRGGMSTSVYLMQLRVVAQGALVSALTFGIGYSLAKQMFSTGDSSE